MARKQSAVRTLRNRLGLSQENFWRVVGLTQSGGSRYEAGRSMPKPVAILVKIAYGSDSAAARQIRQLRAVQ